LRVDAAGRVVADAEEGAVVVADLGPLRPQPIAPTKTAKQWP
jgi:hypothetical protein